MCLLIKMGKKRFFIVRLRVNSSSDFINCFLYLICKFYIISCLRLAVRSIIVMIARGGEFRGKAILG